MGNSSQKGIYTMGNVEMGNSGLGPVDVDPHPQTHEDATPESVRILAALEVRVYRGDKPDDPKDMLLNVLGCGCCSTDYRIIGVIRV